MGHGYAARSRRARVPGHPKVLVAISVGMGYGRDMIAGIVSYARAHGPWEFIGQVGPDVQAAAIAQAPRYDGVIFHQMGPGAVEVALARGAPAVSVGGEAPTPGIPHVTADSDAVARMAFDYYRRLGFSRFATYGGNPQVRTRRIEVFAMLAREAGFLCTDLGPGSRHQWFNANENRLWDREIRKLKRELPKLDGRVAVFAWSSEEARPIVAACDELGIDVPDHIAVLGVDDDEAICELANPPISAIDHGCETIGWEAARILDAIMHGKPPDAAMVRVDPVRVVVRQSTNTLAIDDPMVVESVQFIRTNFAEGITVGDVLDASDVSRPTLEQHFKRALGRTIHRQITIERMEHAKELLHSTELSLAAISTRCGFSYPSKFSTAFRRETGVSPSEYRQRGRSYQSNLR